MGESFLIQRDLLEANIEYFAVVSVTCPSNTTLTFTEDIETFSSSDDGKKWICLIPYAGTWTFTATNDGETKSETVEITSEGQFESLRFIFKWVLFDNGSYVEETGGFTSIASNQLNTYATTTSTSGASSWSRSNSLIDFTGYTTLHFQVTQANVGQFSSSRNRKLGLVSAVGGSSWLVSKDIENESTGEHTIDISSISSGVIGLYASCWANTSGWYNECSLLVSKVWAT